MVWGKILTLDLVRQDVLRKNEQFKMTGYDIMS